MRGTYSLPTTSVAVRIRLSDGTSLAGKLAVRSGKSLGEALNDQSLFVELELPSGELTFLAKVQILSLAAIDMPKLPNLLGALNGEDFDPYAILNVERGTAPDAIRQAYLRITKRYHPDRFASTELPEEVMQYLGTMARRINAAYALIESQFECEQVRDWRSV